jgi:hypothetical protein
VKRKRVIVRFNIMKKALLVLAIAFAALQTSQPANAYYGGPGNGYGGPANYMNMGGPGYGGPGMFGGNQMGYFGRPGYGGYHRCYHHRHWRRW